MWLGGGFKLALHHHLEVVVVYSLVDRARAVEAVRAGASACGAAGSGVP